MERKQKIALVLNTAWNIYNFRQNLVRQLTASGYEVLLIAPVDDYVDSLKPLGCRFIAIKHLDKRGTNPLKDARLVFELRSIFRKERPDLILNFTIKPNIFGSLAAKLLGTKAISTLTGRGRVELSSSIFDRGIKLLYRMAFSYCEKVVFQNHDDLNFFLTQNLVNKAKCIVVPGSGVDLQQFHPNGLVKDPALGDKTIFLLGARLLLDKGIREYTDAAKQVKAKYPDTEFWLLGPVDDNPNQINEQHLKDWEKEGAIKYLGVTDNVQQFLTNADVVVLPSYYGEGVPRTLLESLAMQKPIITTDHTGCRDTVDEGENGFLIPIKDVDALVEAMEKMIALGDAGREAMGKKSRKKAEQEFDDKIVISAYLKTIRSILT
ncbi:MAG: glycosyltransferase family 4 protein [Bacteroidota bacterium]